MNDTNLTPENTVETPKVESEDEARETAKDENIKRQKARRAEKLKARRAAKLDSEASPLFVSGSLPTSELDTRGKKIWQRSWLWFVILPFALCCVYFGLIASDRYVGEAKVIVKQADSTSNVDFGMALLGVNTSAGSKDAQLVREYILSLDMLHKLDRSLSLREHYQSKDADLLSRLWQRDSQEDFLEFYRQHITVVYDDLSGVLTIRAQGFSSEFAQKIVQAVLQFSEQYINQIGQHLAGEQVKFVQNELDMATEHLKKSKQVILEFQEKYQLFNPEQESGAKLTMVNELEAELTRRKTELNNLRSYMNDSAADIVALKAKIGALEKQLLIERSKLVGDMATNFSDINAKHAGLLLDLEFATDLYKGSLVSLEQVRIEAYRKLKYLVVVDSPSLAEEAEFPKRLYNLVSILVVLSLLYGAGKITWATIKEHRDV